MITPPLQAYRWQSYQCVYEHYRGSSGPESAPLVLVHPIGVGLSRRFWHRFCQAWVESDSQADIYNPDLLGCGESDLPHLALYPEDWADQLGQFFEVIIKRPGVIVAQGALMPVAVEFAAKYSQWVEKLVLVGPPAWSLISQPQEEWPHTLAWNVFDSPLGWGFYLYARSEGFLRDFSIKQLFARPEDVDAEWLSLLEQGSQSLETRHAVYSFLSGFWRKDYRPLIAKISQPVLVIMGEEASSISRSARNAEPEDRLQDYLNTFPQAQGVEIPGRNVLPYEATAAFTQVVQEFVTGANS